MSVYAILGIIVALCGLIFWISRNGAAKERAKEAEERLAARAAADDIDNQVHDMAPATQREELKKWS